MQIVVACELAQFHLFSYNLRQLHTSLLLAALYTPIILARNTLTQHPATYVMTCLNRLKACQLAKAAADNGGHQIFVVG